MQRCNVFVRACIRLFLSVCVCVCAKWKSEQNYNKNSIEEKIKTLKNICTSISDVHFKVVVFGRPFALGVCDMCGIFQLNQTKSNYIFVHL